MEILVYIVILIIFLHAFSGYKRFIEQCIIAMLLVICLIAANTLLIDNPVIIKIH